MTDATTIICPNPSDPASRGHLSVSVRNIGQGAAIVTSLSITLAGDPSWHGKMSRSIVPPNEHTRLTFTVPTDRPELARLLDAMDGAGQSFNVVIGYTDLSGTDMLTTRLMFNRLGGDWRIRQLAVSDGTNPEIVSGPADG